MQRITQDSLRELNGQLDASQVMADLGSRRTDARGDTLICDCPLEPGVKAVLTVEVPANFALCSSKTCPASQRRSLLWIFCKASGKGLQEGAQELASRYDVLLEYEGEEPPKGEPPKAIELVEAPPEIGPVESASIVSERRAERVEQAQKLMCPILKMDCLEDGCRLWVVEWLEEKHTYRRNCAISLIAVALAEEAAALAKKK